MRIKDDLFVSSLIRNRGLRKQRERGEQTRTLVYFSRGGRGEKARGYQNVIISSALGVDIIFYFSYSDICLVITHCGSNLYFSNG